MYGTRIGRFPWCLSGEVKLKHRYLGSLAVTQNGTRRIPSGDRAPADSIHIVCVYCLLDENQSSRTDGTESTFHSTRQLENA